MNTVLDQPVVDRTRESCRRVCWHWLVAVVISSSWLGCVQIDGGAIELSWALRDFDGDSAECIDMRIDVVTLCWRDAFIGGPLECDPGSSRDFVCEVEQGATAFEVQTGDQSLWIEVSCSNTSARAERSTYDVPAPIVRTITDGDIITLNSLLVIAARPDSQENCGDRPCTCPAL